MTTSSLKLTTFAASLALFGHIAGTVVLPTNASAADMLEDYEAVDEVTEVEFGTGWYLRGDIGAGMGDVSLSSTILSGDIELDSPVSLSLGAGRNFAEGVRLEAEFNTFQNSDFSAATMMANVYADLGTYLGLRPYIGAGLGGAYVYWDDITTTSGCGGGGPSACTLNSDEAVTYAAAAMAGVSYKLSRSTFLDLGYRLTYFGELGDFSGTDSNSAAGTVTVGNRLNHEIRVGFRYEIW